MWFNFANSQLNLSLTQFRRILPSAPRLLKAWSSTVYFSRKLDTFNTDASFNMTEAEESSISREEEEPRAVTSPPPEQRKRRKVREKEIDVVGDDEASDTHEKQVEIDGEDKKGKSLFLCIFIMRLC